jgi:hypothetical protein
MDRREKVVAIAQSNYIPWKGYFDLIAAVDEFVLYDDMQYTRRDWRNRNKIKTPQGVQWLTVPVKVKGKYHQTIRETEIDGTDWASMHWKTLSRNYCRAPHYNELAAILEPLLLGHQHTHLSALNRLLLQTVCAYLGIKTKISDSGDYRLIMGKTERLADICLQAYLMSNLRPATPTVWLNPSSAYPTVDCTINEKYYRRRGIQPDVVVMLKKFPLHPNHPGLTYPATDPLVRFVRLRYRKAISKDEYEVYVKCEHSLPIQDLQLH